MRNAPHTPPQKGDTVITAAMCGFGLSLALLLGASLPLHQTSAAESEWNLVWQDDFERAELGTNWFLWNGTASLTNGQLFLLGPGAVLLVDRSFASDVQLQFTARANPDQPPCDLSVAMGANRLYGYDYLLAFGGNHNQLNQILGGGARKVDRNPPLLITPGSTYHLTARKEGARLSYWVDGRKLIESTDPDPVGGPGFDRVGLVTWNGMLVDEIRIYERATPAPGGPEILRALPAAGLSWRRRTLSVDGEKSEQLLSALEHYNAGRLPDAFEVLSQLSPPTLRSLAALAWVLGDLAYQERPGDQARLTALARQLVEIDPQNPAARDFLTAAQWFERVTVTSRDRRAVTRLVGLGPNNNPFFYKARLYQARYHYASAVEGAHPRRIREATQMFAALKELWPEHPALREFTGDKLPWGENLIRPESAGPAWARYLQEALARQHTILHWWFTQRQAPDGQLGGGWGDDVELLRNWGPVASITSAGQTALAGIDRLAEGLWHSVLLDGFSPEIGDVEHSAEPSADVLPTLILLRYGDPRPFCWNLRSAKTIRDRFLETNQRGYLQFISAEFGAQGVNRHPAAGGDTGYHARAMKHFIWLAWYGLPEARDVFLNWCDNWREATILPIDTKPPGFVPASLFFPSGDIHPASGRSWHDPIAHYYGFPGLPTKIHDAFLTACFLSGDGRFLEPVRQMLDLSTTGPLRNFSPSRPGDDPDNLLAHLSHQASPDVLAVYRWLTHDPVYDDFLQVRGRPLQRFFLQHNLPILENHLGQLCQRLRYNWARRTSEVLQTDRAGLEGAETTFAAYTGAVRDFTDSGAPTMAVTWDTPDLNFAALVTHASPERLRVQLFNFNPTPQRFGLRPWRLQPGRYRLRMGQGVPAERPELIRSHWIPPREITHRHRGSPIPMDIPPGQTWIIDLTLLDPLPHPGPLPDLAIHPRDLHVKNNQIHATVYNIGGAPAGRFTVACEQPQGNSWQTTARIQIAGLPACTHFEPAKTNLLFSLPPLPGNAQYRLRLDSENALEEICIDNNQAVFRPGNRSDLGSVQE